MQIRSLIRFLRYACKPCRYRQVADSIFICYRQADTKTAAKNLEALLAAEFGTEHVFRDERALLPGESWRNTIENRLRAAAVVLVLIGPRWLFVTDDRVYVVEAGGDKDSFDPAEKTVERAVLTVRAS